MNRFAEILRRTNERLDLPQPARARILLELAADLEDCYARLRARGLDEQDAHREAVERFELADEALAELSELHSRRLRRWLYGLPPKALSRFERGLLAAVAVVVAASCGPLLAQPAFVPAAGPFLWPAVAGVALAVVLFLAKLYELEIKQQHGVRTLRRRLAAIAWLGLGSVISGMTGTAWGFSRAAGRYTLDPEVGLQPLLAWLQGSSALMIAALLGGIVCALLWFGLHQRIGRIERAESESLIETITPPILREA